MKKIILSIVVVLTALCVTGCSKNNLKTISYSELEKKIENKESFILEVIQTGCSACEDFTPRFESVLNDKNVTAYSINLKNMNEEETKKFDEIININSTPTVVFFKSGEEESVSYRIIGAVSNDKIIQKLKSQGYIK